MKPRDHREQTDLKNIRDKRIFAVLKKKALTLEMNIFQGNVTWDLSLWFQVKFGTSTVFY